MLWKIGCTHILFGLRTFEILLYFPNLAMAVLLAGGSVVTGSSINLSSTAKMAIITSLNGKSYKAESLSY